MLLCEWSCAECMDSTDILGISDFFCYLTNVSVIETAESALSDNILKQNINAICSVGLMFHEQK
jgi:hypothetical protein